MIQSTQEATARIARAAPGAGLFRRLAAGFYDLLLVLALWALATLIIVLARGGTAVPTGHILYQLLLLLIAGGFFAAFWTCGGQTLGMRAWRLQVRSRSGGPLTLRQAMLRLAALPVSLLPLGIGLWWLLVDREGLTWHDRIAGTRVIVLPGR